MSLAGRLDEVSVPEVLHLLSWGEKTGKLTLSRAAAEAVVVFRRGWIVNAASNSPREALGSILVCRRLVTEAELIAALEEKSRCEDDRSLGATLVGMGALTGEALEVAVRQQIEQVISEFILWDTGQFRFEPMELPEPAAGSADAALHSNRGFHTEQILLEVIRRADDVRRRREEYAGGALSAALLGDELRVTPFSSPRRRPASLEAIVAELRSPVLRGEAVVTILRSAGTLVRRAVLFIPSHRGFVGGGQFGIDVDGAPADEHIRKVVIPLGQPSVLADAAAKRGTYRGTLPLTFWNEFLVGQLGGRFPREVIVVPAVLDGAVVAVLYGDNVPFDAPIAPVAGLEAAMLDACVRYARPAAAQGPRAKESSGGAPAGPGSAQANP